MLNRLRLLPVLIAAAVLLFGVKVERLWRHGEAVVPPAQAQQAKTEATAEARPAAEDAAKPAGEKPVQTASAEPDRPRVGRFSASEVEVLQKLAARREQLDARAAELDVRENLLQAAEKRLEEKIGKLKELESRIQALLRQHDEEAEKKLASLVKIYETMKPKDAAAIFEQLDLDILLDVVERMREQKMAPILAEMNPARAKEVTVELALRRKLPVSGG
jgi:flagellar motility protein MotE (MotC chaperone)